MTAKKKKTASTALLKTGPDQDALTEVETTVKPEKGLILGLKEGNLKINEKLVDRAFGATDHGFIEGIMLQLVGMAQEGDKVEERWLDLVGGAMVEINPKNGVEAMLAAQITANHLLAMKMARMMITAGNLERMQRLEAMSTKAMRTTAAQIEALHKLRNGGKQNVEVKHVHVNDGGQAIIGNVGRGGE